MKSKPNRSKELEDYLEGLRKERAKPIGAGRIALRCVGLLAGLALAWAVCLGVSVSVLAAVRVAVAIVGWP